MRKSPSAKSYEGLGYAVYGTKLDGVTKGLRTLVPVDGSDASHRALKEILRLMSHSRGDNVIVLHCTFKGRPPLAPHLTPKYIFEGLESSIHPFKVPYELLTFEVDPKKRSLADVICQVAQERNVDVISMGSMDLNRDPDAEALAGSISRQVAAQSACATMVIKHVTHAAQDSEPLKFVVAVNNSPLSKDALDLVLLLARPKDEVIAVYVESSRDPPDGYPFLDEINERLKKAYIAKGETQRLSHMGGVSSGEAICRLVKREDADFLVLGSNALAKGNNFLGSVGQWCFDRAFTNVVVVKGDVRLKDMAAGAAVVTAAVRWRRRASLSHAAKAELEAEAAVAVDGRPRLDTILDTSKEVQE